MKTFLILTSTLLLTTTLALAAPPGHAKLPAPLNVTCPVIGTDVVVAWDLVADAFAYQVEYVALGVGGEWSAGDAEYIPVSVFVLTPPVTIPLDDVEALTIHVRALPAPKHEGGPYSGASPKGQWSSPCVVDLTVPPSPAPVF